MKDIEFPVYFSLVPNPGYNTSFLDTCGIGGEFNLFGGYFFYEDNGTSGTWQWGSENDSIQGKPESLRTIYYIFLKDVWSQSRLDVMEVFKYIQIAYFNTADASFEYDYYFPPDMTEMKMMIETRPRYPSNKLTFTIANITEGKMIYFVNIFLNSFAKFDVDVFLEDSKRNFLNSFRFFWCFKH